MHSQNETTETLVVRSVVVLPWVVKIMLLWATIGSANSSAPWWIPAITAFTAFCMLMVNSTFVSWTTVDGRRREVRQRAWTLFGPRSYLLAHADIQGIEVDTQYWGSGPQKQARQTLRVLGADRTIDLHHANPDVALVAQHEAQTRLLLGIPSPVEDAVATD